MNTFLLIASIVMVYGAGWTSLAVVWARHMDYRDDETYVYGWSFLWPIIWPAVLAFVLLKRLRERDRIEEKVAERLARERRELERKIKETEKQLGIGGGA